MVRIYPTLGSISSCFVSGFAKWLEIKPSLTGDQGIFSSGEGFYILLKAHIMLNWNVQGSAKTEKNTMGSRAFSPSNTSNN